MRPPLVILGPTASGKTALAIELAQAVDGTEIICADSKAVYRGMDVGTAKPTRAERALVLHHGIDLVDPADEFTVASFVESMEGVIESLGGRPYIVAGGTGLYIRTLIDSFELPGQYPETLAEIEAESDTEALWRRLDEADPVAAAKMEPNNRRRILRALEVTFGSGRPFSSFGPGMEEYSPIEHIQIGLEIDREILNQRIDDRFDAQMEAGFLDEVRRIAARSMGRTAAAALGYRELLAHLNGEKSLAEALDEAKLRTRRFSRKQQRWFRRDPRIIWLEATDADLVERAMAVWNGASG